MTRFSHRTSDVGPASEGTHGGSATIRRVFGWHKPLMLLTLACVVLLVVCVIGTLIDPRQLGGVSIWNKPTLFAISIAVYAFTLAWLISLMPRRRRLGSVLGTISAAMLAGEIGLIVLQVARGRASHFDFGTTFDAAVYQLMAAMIGTLWLSNVVLVVWLLTQRLPDRSLTWALRCGMSIAVVGMALAFLMTLPSASQRTAAADGQKLSVIGAHSVGVADGGPGLPVLGWSTVGGDLRIPHFVGLHGLQAMILVALALAALGRRYALLADQTVRVRLVFVTGVAYCGGVAAVTWQALRGQSIVHPDAATGLAFAALVLLTLVGYAAVLVPRRHDRDRIGSSTGSRRTWSPVKPGVAPGGSR